MKYSVFTVMMPEYSVEEAVALLARLGYDGVEWRVTVPNYRSEVPPSYWSNNLCTVDAATVDAQAARLAQLTRAVGLQIPALGTYMACTDRESIARAMRAAAEMGCPRIRVSPPRYERACGYSRLFAEALLAYVEVQELAREYGVQACLEIHMGNICSSPSLASRLVTHFDPRYIGAILDPGNMVYEGYEDWRLGMELLGPYLAHVHLKNAQWQSVGAKATGETAWQASAAGMDKGIIDFRQFTADLRAVGYEGWCSFEDFSDTGSTLDKLAHDIAYVRSL
jgi:sugar phosphate isomerase/epimerase